jgi:RNA polymerase sigma factor (sigma-70 family)
MAGSGAFGSRLEKKEARRDPFPAPAPTGHDVSVTLLPSPGPGGRSAAPEAPRLREDELRAVAAAAAGDPASVRRVLVRVAPSVQRVVRTVLGPAGAHAEDVTQEALLAVVHALGSFRGECGFVHYACRIGARVAVVARRARAAEVVVEPLDAEGARDLPVPGDDPEAPRRRALLRALLDELPEAQAETIVLRVMLGYSMAEVAEATGAPLNTVRSRLRLAKEALRSRIEQDEALAEMLEVG